MERDHEAWLESQSKAGNKAFIRVQERNAQKDVRIM